MNFLWSFLVFFFPIVQCVNFYGFHEECRPYDVETTRRMVAACYASHDSDSMTSRDLCDLYGEIHNSFYYSIFCFDGASLRQQFRQDCQLYDSSAPVYRRCYPFNAEVTRAELWERPLLSSRRKKRSPDWRLSHSGVVVTTKDGRRWLVEKGARIPLSETLVSDADEMGLEWRRKKCGSPKSPTTLGIFWGYGLPFQRYRLLGPNCHTASRYMWYLVDTIPC